MSAYQIKDGRWVVQYRDPESPDKYKREYFGRGSEAQKAAADRNSELCARPYVRRTPADPTPTFETLAYDYVIAKRGENSPQTLRNVRYRLRAYILAEIGEIPGSRISQHRMDQYVAKRLKSVQRSTVRREINDIQAVLNWGVRRRYLQQNPLLGYKKPSADDAVIMHPTKKEVEGLMANSPPHLVRAISMSYYMGLRPGKKELYNLTWENVDWRARTILVVSARKGGLRQRLVPIHTDFMRFLRCWHKQDNQDNGPIVRYQGKPIGSARKAYNSAKKRAGITRRLRMYDFRHAFATLALGRGADLKSTSEILGHARPDITMRVYQHTDLSAHRRTVAKIPAIIIPSGTTNVVSKQQHKKKND